MQTNFPHCTAKYSLLSSQQEAEEKKKEGWTLTCHSDARYRRSAARTWRRLFEVGPSRNSQLIPRRQSLILGIHFCLQ